MKQVNTKIQGSNMSKDMKSMLHRHETKPELF